MKYLGALIVGGVFLVMAVESVGATVNMSPVPPPDIELFEAYGFENVLEPDDRLLLVRYELPLDPWQSATTTTANPERYMVNATCTEVEGIVSLEDTCYTSLYPGMVLNTFYDGTRGGSGVTQHGIRTIPRVGDGLSGIYIRAGHSLAPAGSATANTYQVCVEGSPTVFANPLYTVQPVGCLNPIWYATTGTEDKVGMTGVLLQLGLNLEEEMIKPVNYFVAQDKITENGVTMPREAFTGIVRAAPNAFYTGIKQPWRDVSQVVQETNTEALIRSDTENTRIYLAFEGAAQQYFGTSAKVFGGLTMLLIGAIAVMAVGATTGSITLGSITGFLILMMGVFLGVVHVGALWATIGILTLVGSTYVFRKFPSG